MRVLFAAADGRAAGALPGREELRGEPAVIVQTGEPVPSHVLEALWRAHARSGAVLTVAARRGRFDEPLENVLLAGADGRLIGVQPVRERSEALSDLVPAGLYVVAPEALDYLPEAAADWMGDVLPALLAYDAPVQVWSPAGGQATS